MRKGFTLLELVVATVIFMVVVGACFALFESSRGVSSRAEARMLLFQTARAALRALEEDLRGATPTGTAFDGALTGTSAGSADGPLDRIEVTSTGSDGRIDLSKVSYWIADGTTPSKHGLVRERQDHLMPVVVLARREENVEEVSPDVLFLDLRYYGETWETAWDTRQQTRWPKAIEATVHVRGEWRGEEIVEQFTTRFYLPLGAEAPERQP